MDYKAVLEEQIEKLQSVQDTLTQEIEAKNDIDTLSDVSAEISLTIRALVITAASI